MGIYNDEDMHDFRQENHDAASSKIRLNCCKYWICRKLHKKLYKQRSTKKAGNIDLAIFLAFECAPKLLFGNVIRKLNS